MANLMAGAGLLLATLSGALLVVMGLSADSGRDGGRVLGVATVSLPFWAGLLLAYGVATVRGGIDALGLPRGALLPLVLVGVTAAVVVNAFAAALRLEPASQVPWAMWPLRAWAPAVWPPLLLAGAVWVLWPTWFGEPQPGGLRGPLLVPVALGLASLLVCALMAVQWLQWRQQDAARRVQAHQDEATERDRWVRAQVEAADPERDLVSLMNQTSRHEVPAIRALALAKVAAHPRLTEALATMLRGRFRDHALTYLDSNEPPDAAALAEPVREAILGMAEDIADRMRRTHTLRADEFEPEVARVLTVADRFAAQGLDYRPAVRAVHAALDQPRHDDPPTLNVRRTLERWLARAESRADPRGTGRGPT